MNWQRIQYFLTFCESMHFSNAARLLGISQPALTKAISQLENELGTRLIRREGKHTQLTEHGESVRAKYAELTYRALDIAGDVRNIVRGGDEKICIGVTPFVDFAPFAEFLVTFHQKCPHAFIDVIECSEHDSEQKLLHGEVDCVLTVQKDTINGRVSHFEIYETCLEMVGKSSISAHNVVSMQQVASMQQNEAEVGKQLSKSQSQLVWQQKHGEYVQIAVCSQQIWAQQLLKSGLGIGLQPRSTARIKGISSLGYKPEMEMQSTYAVIPVGRNDSRSFIHFVDLLNKYEWVAEKMEV